MPAEPIWLHPDAVNEARAARKWYEARNAEAAGAFMDELDTAIEQIEQGPRQWPPYPCGTRRYLPHRFPFSVVFRETPVASRYWLSHMDDGGPDTGFGGKLVEVGVPGDDCQPCWAADPQTMSSSAVGFAAALARLEVIRDRQSM